MWKMWTFLLVGVVLSWPQVCASWDEDGWKLHEQQTCVADFTNQV